MQSEQEKLINLFFENSMGANFVFAPDRYGGDEPADLVWAANNCVILMTMTKRAKGSKEQMFKHNFGQLRGSVRKWKKGRAIKGKSRTGLLHYIRFDDYRYKILISIVHGPDSTAEYHQPMITELNNKGFDITACVTIPQNVIEFIAKFNGSTLDLLNFIQILKKSKKITTAQEALNIITAQNRDAFALLKASQRIPDFEPDEGLAQIVKSLRDARSDKGLQVREIQSVLSDLSWVSTIQLIYSIHYAHKLITDVPIGKEGPKQAMGRLLSSPYVFMYGIARGFNTGFNEYLQTNYRFMEEVQLSHPDLKPVFLLITIIDIEKNMSAVYGTKEKKVKSLTEIILENWEK